MWFGKSQIPKYFSQNLTFFKFLLNIRRTVPFKLVIYQQFYELTHLIKSVFQSTHLQQLITGDYYTMRSHIHNLGNTNGKSPFPFSRPNRFATHNQLMNVSRFCVPWPLFKRTSLSHFLSPSQSLPCASHNLTPAPCCSSLALVFYIEPSFQLLFMFQLIHLL